MPHGYQGQLDFLIVLHPIGSLQSCLSVLFIISRNCDPVTRSEDYRFLTFFLWVSSVLAFLLVFPTTLLNSMLILLGLYLQFFFSFDFYT